MAQEPQDRCGRNDANPARSAGLRGAVEDLGRATERLLAVCPSCSVNRSIRRRFAALTLATDRAVALAQAPGRIS